MEKNKAITAVIITLVIGLAIGYGAGVNNKNGRYTDITRTPMMANGQNQVPAGSHMMPGGQMMGDNMMANGGAMSMQDMMQSMNAALAGKTGDEFDKAFLAEMIVHHQGAVEMATAALINAKHKEIKDLANAIFSAQNKEIAEMKAWQKSWYGNR